MCSLQFMQIHPGSGETTAACLNKTYQLAGNSEENYIGVTNCSYESRSSKTKIAERGLHNYRHVVYIRLLFVVSAAINVKCCAASTV